ncbi:MAG: hypothetical protein LBF58_07615 [Deltaproteobacteria bacterium]|nr:hypothetical protein [Deltaproteobacteria bacterium]
MTDTEDETITPGPTGPAGPRPVSEDASELELIRQAGLFFWRAGSPRGQRRLLGAARARRDKILANAAEYLAILRRSPAEWDELWDLVDSGREDSFFRYPAQFDLLSDLLAEMAITATDRKLRVLSAGCGPGFEAYSLSMFLRGQSLSAKGWDLSIDAFDLSEKLLARAREANFKRDDLEWLTPESARRWFTLRAAGWHFKAELGPPVNFLKRNLAGDGPIPDQAPEPAAEAAPDSAAGAAPGPEPPDGPPEADQAVYGVIFCRGMSFDCPDHQVKALARRIVSMLAPGGILMTAPGEIWPEVWGLGLEERDGVIYGRKAEGQKAKANVFHSPRAKADGRKESVGGERARPGDPTDPARESLTRRFSEILPSDPDGARDLVLEMLGGQAAEPRLDPEALALMAEVDEALGREECAAAARALLAALA